MQPNTNDIFVRRQTHSYSCIQEKDHVRPHQEDRPRQLKEKRLLSQH